MGSEEVKIVWTLLLTRLFIKQRRKGDRGKAMKDWFLFFFFFERLVNYSFAYVRIRTKWNKG